MPTQIVDLTVDRVDFVDEGANSAAFIELIKRKEPTATMTFEEIVAKLKPEHASIVSDKVAEVTKSRDDTAAALAEATAKLTEAQNELGVLKAKDSGCGTSEQDKPEDTEKACDTKKACDEDTAKAKEDNKQTLAMDEAEVLKSMPDEARKYVEQLKKQRDAAEEQIRKSAEAEAERVAVAKAADLKALPMSQEKLLSVVKSCPEDVYDVLKSLAKSFEETTLSEVGKSAPGHPADPWTRIESEAMEIAKGKDITKQQAIALVIKNKPDLYKEYLAEGEGK